MRRPLLLFLVLFLAAAPPPTRSRSPSRSWRRVVADALRASAPGLTIAVRQGNSTAVEAWGQHAAALVYQTPR